MKYPPQPILATKLRKRAGVIAAAALVGAALAAAPRSARADTLYSFGLNEYGNLGNGLSGGGTSGANSSGTAVAVLGLDNSVTAMTVGPASLAVDNGALYGWGRGDGGQLGVGGSNASQISINVAPVPTLLTSGVTAVGAGAFVDVALVNGGVYTTGNNFGRGTLGRGTYGEQDNSPALTSNPIMNSGVSTIAVGSGHVLAIRNGALYAWGFNGQGQLGNGSQDPNLPVPTPFAVPGMGSGVTAIGAGFQTSLAVKDGAGYAWGFNQYAALGIGSDATSGTDPASLYPSPTPIALPSGVPVTTLAAGTDFSLGLVQGVVYAWGRNETGELGIGSTSGLVNDVPAQVPTITGFIIGVKAGNNTGYALGADGTLWSWGSNSFGQLGIGTIGGTRSTAQHILPPAGKVFTALGAGSNGSTVLITLGAAPTSWASDISGLWNDNTNWTAGVPNSVDAAVYFTSPPISATRTILTTTAVTVGNLSFNSASSYIIAGTGSITVKANLASSVRGAAINDYVGNHTVAPATLECATNSNVNVSYGSTLTLGSPTGNVVIDSNTAVSETAYGTVAFTSAVSLLNGASLNLTTPTAINALTLASSAVTRVAPHGFYADNLLTLGSLSLNATSQVDLANNEAIVHNGNITAISAALGTGINNGAWNGSGIVSSTAAADTTKLTALGSLKATTAMQVSGQSLVPGDVLIKYTYYGDADLSGTVDGSDYSRIDNGFLSQSTATPLTGWNNGDFNYDNVINGSDYTLIDNAFNTQGAQINAQLVTPTAQLAGATSAVPEPTSIALFGIAATTLLGRRRRLR